MNVTRAHGSLALGQISRVTTDRGLELDPAISPDGRAIAYAAGVPGRMRIYVRQISGGRMVPLTDEGMVGGQRWPQWSPDGTRIVFQAGRPRIATRLQEGTGALFVVPALGGVARQLTGGVSPDVVVAPTWSPDGRQVAFGGVDGPPPSLPRAAKRRAGAIPEAHSPAWSPGRTTSLHFRQ